MMPKSAASGPRPTPEHHPVGAYLPVGQLDGDCSCGDGPWPCPALVAAPATVTLELEAVELEEFILDEINEHAAIDPEDYAPTPEFSDFDVWCPLAEDWAPQWRPGPDHPWFCRNCGATDHQQFDATKEIQ